MVSIIWAALSHAICASRCRRCGESKSAFWVSPKQNIGGYYASLVGQVPTAAGLVYQL